MKLYNVLERYGIAILLSLIAMAIPLTFIIYSAAYNDSHIPKSEDTKIIGSEDCSKK